MTQVDPLPIQIPQELQSTREMRAFFENLIRSFNDLWLRSGGSNDSISYIDDTLNAQDSRKLPEIRNLTKKVNAIQTELDRANTEIAILRKKMNQLTEQNTITAELKRITARIDALELS